MPKYKVVADVREDGTTCYLREFDEADATDAAEMWAGWFCHHTAEWGGPIECYVSEDVIEWQRYLVDIEFIPSLHASAAE